MRVPNNDGKMMAEINIIPLVDISLVLLIIFMVTTAFVKEAGLNMKLPKAATTEAAPEKQQDISIAIAGDRKLYFDGRATTPEQLRARLRMRAAKSTEDRVIIKGDQQVPYGKIMMVLDEVKLAGFSHIALATEPVLEAPSSDERR
ncbi:MAG TPA: biopolymer transporter ExbD [Armatimonadetes bacterium]|jgi:biopolymer transport protein TolR|nr:biopolymer transporter ExbD [Armatimonadota bacterium]